MKITIQAVDGHVTSVSSPKIEKIAEVYRRHIGDSDTGVSEDGVCVAYLDGCTVADLFATEAERDLDKLTLSQLERALSDAFILLDEALYRREYTTYPEPMDVPNARRWVAQLQAQIDRTEAVTMENLWDQLACAEEYEEYAAMGDYNEDTGGYTLEGAARGRHWLGEIQRRIKRETDKMFPAYPVAAAGFLELPKKAYEGANNDHDLPF